MINPEVEKQFEKDKNMKAAGITIAVIAAVFLLMLISWIPDSLPVQPADLGVEVNLGNSDQGSGDVAPMSPGEATQATAVTSTPPPPAQQIAETQPPVIPNNDENATPVNTSPKPVKKTPKNVINAEKVRRPKPVATPAPPSPPKPKAQLGVLKKAGESGNNSDNFNNVRNQGIAGGNGDLGKPNGNPNSNNYTGYGGTGTSGVSITDGLNGRRVAGNFHFEDSYSHGGTVMVRVTVDENGKVTEASLDLPSGNPEIDKIAVRRAYEVKFSKGTSVQTGRLKIRFENPKG